MPPTLDALNENSTTKNPQGSLRLGFLPATPDDLQSSPLPSPARSPEETSDPEDLSASAGEWLDEPFPESLDPSSSEGPGSSPSDAEAVGVDLFSEDDLRTMTRAGIMAAGEKAHDVFATTPGQKAVDLYKTDEQDQAQIGDPLASIAARHQGVAGKVNPDTKDFLSALVGLFAYGTKQINKRTQAKALDAGAGGLAGNPQPMPQAVDL